MNLKAILVAAAVWCVILATAHFREYGVYQLSKWLITGAAIYAAVHCPRFRAPLAVVAVVFNPVVPIRFSRSTWQVLDFAAAGIFAVGSFIGGKR